MAGSVFTVRCWLCKGIVGAYDPARSDPVDMGNAVRYAAKSHEKIAFEPSPVEVVACTCSPNDCATGKARE